MGRFFVPMDLRDFPLDQQRFKLQVASIGNPREEVNLIPYADLPHRAEQLSVTDWFMGSASMQQSDVEISPGVKSLAGVELTWVGHRHFDYYALQVILPLVAIVIMGWTALLLNHSDIAPRINVSTTAMLTLIAYRFSLGNQIPHLSYLTRFDYFMTGSTILVFFMLVAVAGGAYLERKGKVALVLRLDRWMRVGFPLTFISMTLLLWKL